MSKSKNIGLHLTPASEKEKSFLNFRTELAGENCNSNMEIIDAEIGKLQDNDESHVKTTTAPNNDTPTANDGVHGIRYTKDKKLKIKNHLDVWDTVINPYKTYTAVIDETEDDPDLMVSYADDAIDLEARSDEWLETDIFKDIRPCVFRDGKVQCYLDPNDFTSQIKNTDPIFYEDNDFMILANSSYTQVVESEQAMFYDVDGNALGRVIDEDFVAPSGVVIQNNSERGYNTVIHYKDTDGYMEYEYNVPTDGDYYLIMRFDSTVSEKVRIQDISINGGERKTIEFPQIGLEKMHYNSWSPSRFEFQIMRYAVSLKAGRNTVRISCPIERLTGTRKVSTVGIHYIALKSIDPVDTSTGIPRAEFSAFTLEPYAEGNKTWTNDKGLQELDIHTAGLDIINGHQVIKFTPAEGKTAADQACRVEAHLWDNKGKIHDSSIQNYPVVRVDFNAVIKNGFELKTLEAMLPYTKTVTAEDGTETTSTVWVQTWGLPVIERNSYADGSDSTIIIDFTNFNPDNSRRPLVDTSTTTYVLDRTERIQTLWIKPWGNDKVMDTDDYFAIQSIGFFKNVEDAQYTYTNSNTDEVDTFDKFAPNGECMIEIPKMGYRVHRVGDTVRISVTRDDEAYGYTYEAFSRDGGDTLQDYLYIGAYPNVWASSFNTATAYGSYTNSTNYDDDQYSIEELRSRVSDKNAMLDSAGYSLFTYYVYNLIACLSVLYNKSVKAPNSGITLPNQSGIFDKYGMMHSTHSGYKFIGLESLYKTLLDGVTYIPSLNYEVWGTNNNISSDGLENAVYIGNMLMKTDYYVIGSGDCSADDGESNVSWTLYKDGTLVISGIGKMASGSPWTIGQEIDYNIKSVVIEYGVTSIGGSAFYQCCGITNVSIPSSVTSILSGAFYRCVALENIYLPDSITSIGADAFSGCSSLKGIVLPKYIKAIYDYTFYSCTNLRSICIPKNLIKGDGDYNIYPHAFDSVNKYFTVHFEGTETEWEDISINSSGNEIFTTQYTIDSMGENPYDGYSYLLICNFDGTRETSISYYSNGMDIECPETHFGSYGYDSNSGVTVCGITPVCKFYTFKGWSTTKEGDVEYIPGDIVFFDPGFLDLVLYAVWEETTELQETVTSGYVTSIIGNNTMPFIPKKVGGSSNSYYCGQFNLGTDGYFSIMNSAFGITGLVTAKYSQPLTRTMYLKDGE